MTSDHPASVEPGKAPLGFRAHDHSVCLDKTLKAVEDRCAEQGLRLTAVRRKVLELLLQEHRAMGAYAILELLRQEGFGSQPPVAYRALDFLSEHGFVHKIERLNSFVACAHPGENHSPIFMICRVCNTVAEACAPYASGMLGDAASDAGFQIEKVVVEAEGVCPDCVNKIDA